MVNIKGRRCNAPGCQHRPGFAMPTDRRGKFCATHRQPGMIDVVRCSTLTHSIIFYLTNSCVRKCWFKKFLFQKRAFKKLLFNKLFFKKKLSKKFLSKKRYSTFPLQKCAHTFWTKHLVFFPVRRGLRNCYCGQAQVLHCCTLKYQTGCVRH